MKKLPYHLFSYIILTCVFQHVKGQQATIPESKNALVVIAHRGNHVDAQENTITAYSNAIKAGADYVEIDLRTSKDSQLVIMHDGTVNRMTNGSGKVNGLTWAELKQLKVTDKNHPEWPEEKIPLFSEVLQVCKGKINIYLDFKDADVKATYNAIVAAGMQHSVIVYINAAHQFTDWKNIAPQIPLMVSLPDTIKSAAELSSLIKQFQMSILDGSYTAYNIEMVKTALQNNVPVWPDIQSVNEGPEEWERAINMGFTGLQTDHPEALILFLKNKKLRK